MGTSGCSKNVGGFKFYYPCPIVLPLYSENLSHTQTQTACIYKQVHSASKLVVVQVQ